MVTAPLAGVVGARADISPTTRGVAGGLTRPRSAQVTDGGMPAIGVATHGAIGKILVDSHGTTLYLVQKARRAGSVRTGACGQATSRWSAPGRALRGDESASLRRRPQVVYHGHPPYLFSGDENPGDTNGRRPTALDGASYAVSAAGMTVTAARSRPSGSGSTARPRATGAVTGRRWRSRCRFSLG